MSKSPDLQALPHWQDCLSNLITDPFELLDMLGLDADSVGYSEAALRDFVMKVPRPYAGRIRPGNPDDPLLLQVLPDAREMLDVPGFGPDPLGESETNPLPGLLHKYHGRALLMPSTTCAVHCRYCFRRHFPYDDNRPSREMWRESLDYLASNDTITEVILSGGDPLVVSDRHLAWLLDELAGIDHISRLRIHSRLPMVIPQRVTAELCALLAGQRLSVSLVLHANHAQELDDAVANACVDLRRADVTLLNQSVLLKGVNDNVRALRELSETLFAMGVIPYYLHMLDHVRGGAHFDVTDADALALIAQLRALLPGYLMPRLVRETAGREAKTPVV